MSLSTIKTVITRGAGRGWLIAKKYSPEILLGLGVVGGVASTVMACKATLKADEIIDESKEMIGKIHHAKELIDTGVSTKEYSQKDYQKDLGYAYAQGAKGFAKLYWPAVTVGVGSIACILVSHGILKRRHLAVVAAFKAVEESFSRYRKRVVDEYGEDKDKEFKYGIKKVEVTEMPYTDENGKKHKAAKTTVNVIDPNGLSIYAKIFDKSSIHWSEVPEYNVTFLKVQQAFANDILHTKGHIFLNEVYDMLGIPRTKEGAVAGWVMGQGDEFVDFGMFDVDCAAYENDKTNDTIGEQRADFINGRKTYIILDFNVDGLMYDKI